MVDSYSIERMSYGPDAISHTPDGKAVFLSGCAAVGDTVQAETLAEKKNYINARIVQIEDCGPHHCEPHCEALCGGCPWRAMDYAAQIAEKERNIAFNLSRVAGLSEADVARVLQPAVVSEQTLNYRNKVELGISLEPDGIHVGMSSQLDGAVQTVAQCRLFPEGKEGIPQALQGALRMALKRNLYGLFRIGIRCSQRSGQCEIALWGKPGPFPRDVVRSVLASAFKPFGGVSSIVRVIADPGKQRRIKRVEVLDGKGYWEEELRICGQAYRFKTSAPSFFQVNTAAAEELVEDALDKLSGALPSTRTLRGMRIADLYAGGGTFSIPLAAAGADVVAVESASSSVKDMKRNAEVNHVCLECVGGDSARELPHIGPIDALIVDPPRAGLAQDVIRSIAKLAPNAVVYVSCDPVTLCRDMRLLGENGYEIVSVTPHDLFPQTYHVETVSLLSRTTK